MRVDWEIGDYFIDGVCKPPFTCRILMDDYCDEDFTAQIRGRDNVLVLEKSHSSLVELMSWAEEELMFKASHSEV